MHVHAGCVLFWAWQGSSAPTGIKIQQGNSWKQNYWSSWCSIDTRQCFTADLGIIRPASRNWPSWWFCLAWEVWEKPHHIYEAKEKNRMKRPKLAFILKCFCVVSVLLPVTLDIDVGNVWATSAVAALRRPAEARQFVRRWSYIWSHLMQ